MQQIESVDTTIQTTNPYVKKTLFGKDGGAGAKDFSSGDMVLA
jgi:hypothetical protein